MESPDAFFGTHVTQPFFTNQRLGTARLLFRPDYRLLKPKTLRKAPAHLVRLMPVNFVVRSIRQLAPEQGKKIDWETCLPNKKVRQARGVRMPNAGPTAVSSIINSPSILGLFLTFRALKAELPWDLD